MNKLLVLLIAVLLIQSALAKSKKKNKKDSSSSSSSSSSSDSSEKKKHPKVVCPVCPPRQIIAIREVTACELDQKHLTCPAGSTIRIHEAFYGRRNSYTCLFQDNGKDVTQVCSVPNAIEVVRNRCTGKRVCDLTGSTAWFSDPCRNVYKYLQVSFSCTAQ